MTIAPADWDTLGLSPTSDVDAVRRAYRARLKVVGPEQDPEGFQRLRTAYEAVLADLETTRSSARSGDSSRLDEGAGTAVKHVIEQLQACRSAGDEAGAIAVLDAALAASPPGSMALDALEDALLDEVALSRMLSTGLFRHMVACFDWADAQGRAARRGPERHAVLLDRVAAEDWLDALRHEAASPDGLVAAALLGSRWQPGPVLPADGLDPARKARARALFEELREHDRFVLHRIDGASLGRVREAVEGPPLLAEPTLQPAVPALASVLPDPAVVQRRGRMIAAVVMVLIVGGVFGKPYLHDLVSPPDRGMSPELALKDLVNPGFPWLELSPEPGGTLVSWAPLTERRRAIADLRYGANTDEPNAVMNLPENGTPIRFVAPPDLTLMTVRLRYLDGTWSEVRRYPMNGGPKGGATPGGAPRR